MSYTEARDAAMNATLAAIDDVAEVKCGNCNEPLATDGPSGYWCDDWCQAKWMDGQADNPRDVYDRADAAGGAYSDSMHSHGNLPGMTVEEAAEAMGVTFAALGRSVTDWEESAIQVRDAVNASPYEVSAYERAMQRIEDDPNGVPEYAAIAQRWFTGIHDDIDPDTVMTPEDAQAFQEDRGPVIPFEAVERIGQAAIEQMRRVQTGMDRIQEMVNTRPPIETVSFVRGFSGGVMEVEVDVEGTIGFDGSDNHFTLAHIRRNSLGHLVLSCDTAPVTFFGEPDPEPVLSPRERALQARQSRNTGPEVRRRGPNRIDPRGTR